MKQHMAVFQRIGVTALDQPFDMSNHLRDGFRCARLDIRAGAFQFDAILAKPLNGCLRQVPDIDAALFGPVVNLVVDIRDVPNIGDIRIERPQQAHEHIEHHQRPGIPDMNAIIDGGAADIDADLPFLSGFECHLLSAGRVVNL